MINWKKNYGKLFQIEFFKSFRTKSAMRNWLTSQPDEKCQRSQRKCNERHQFNLIILSFIRSKDY